MYHQSAPPTHTHPSKTKNRIFLIYVVVASAATTAKKKNNKKKSFEKRVEECVQLTNQNKRHIRAGSGLGG